MHRYLLCMCFSALCIVEFYLTIKLHAHKYGLTEIRTLQLFFFSLTSGMMEGFQVCEGLLEKNKTKYQSIVLEMEMHPAVGRNPNSFTLQFPSQENRVPHSGCLCVLACQESDVFQAYNFVFQVVFFSFLYVFPFSFGQMMFLMKGHQYSWEQIHKGRIKMGCRFSFPASAA